MAGRRRKAKPADKGPRVFRMAHYSDPDRWYWRTREGRWVDVKFIPDAGVMKLLSMLDERGPEEYCRVMERIARSRGLIDENGRRIPARIDPETSTA